MTTLDRGLWFALLAGPIGWSVAAALGYFVTARACSAGLEPAARFSVLGLGLAALAVSLAAAVVGGRRWKQLSGATSFGADAGDANVLAFLAWAAMPVSLIAALGAGYLVLAAILLDPCARVW